MPRRIRVGDGKLSKAPEKIALTSQEKQKLNRYLKNINDAQDLIESTQNSLKEDMKELDAFMVEKGLGQYKNGKDVAMYETPQGRATSYIDARKLWEGLEGNLDNFLLCVSVIKSKAQKLLGTKELEDMTVTENPKKKSPVLKVSRFK